LACLRGEVSPSEDLRAADAGLLVFRDVVVDVVENGGLVPPVRHDNGGSAYLGRHDACEANACA